MVALGADASSLLPFSRVSEFPVIEWPWQSQSDWALDSPGGARRLRGWLMSGQVAALIVSAPYQPSPLWMRNLVSALVAADLQQIPWVVGAKVPSRLWLASETVRLHHLPREVARACDWQAEWEHDIAMISSRVSLGFLAARRGACVHRPPARVWRMSRRVRTGYRARVSRWSQPFARAVSQAVLVGIGEATLRRQAPLWDGYPPTRTH